MHTSGDAELPAPLREVIESMVRRTRLWPSEQAELAEELLAHFRDGLAAGLSVAELRTSFGDPELAATLVTRAKRRARPAGWRWAHGTLLFAASLLLLLIGSYTASALRLYTASPHQPAPAKLKHPAAWGIATPQTAAPLYRAALHELEWRSAATPQALALARRAAEIKLLGDWSVIVGDRLPMDTPDWSLESPLASDLQHLGRLLIADAKRALEVNLPALAAADLAASISIAGHLRQTQTLADDLASITILHETLISLSEMLPAHAASLGKAERQLLTAHVHSAWRKDLHLRPAVIRAAFDDLFERMYTDDGQGSGRLTGGGLRLLQGLVGKRDPGLGALLLEPAFFALPASRAEVEREVSRLLGLLGSAPRGSGDGFALLEREVSRLRKPPVRALRFLPVSTFMPRVVAAAAEVDGTSRMIARVLQTTNGGDSDPPGAKP